MTTEQPVAKVMLDEKPVKRHSSEKPKKVSDTLLPSNDSGKRAKSNESFDDTMVRIRRNIQRMNDSIKRDRQAWNTFTNHLDELAKRSESNHGPDRFEVIESNLSVLTFGFDKRSTYATNYSYPYYFENMEKLGFLPESKWIERLFTIPETPYERIVSIAGKLKNRLKVVDVAETMSVRKILKLYGAKFFETMNQAYKNLDAYVPIEGKARDNVLKQFATIVNRKYLSV